MSKSKLSYNNLVNGKIVLEKDLDYQQRIKNEIVDIRILVKKLFLNSNFKVEEIKIEPKNDIIILNNGTTKIALLHRTIKNSGTEGNQNKRWQVYANTVCVEGMPNYLLGTYAIGNDVVFTLSDDEVFVRNYANGDSKKSYSSSWISFKLIKSILDEDIVIGSNDLGKNTLGRVRIIFKEKYIDSALETLLDLQYNSNYRPILLPSYKKRKVLDYYQVAIKSFNKENTTYLNSNGKIKIKRNPLYIKLALENADYKCEICESHFSFIKPDGKMYTEGHHLLHVNFNVQKNFMNTHLDHPLNIFSLCPNCHRKIHLANKEDRRKLIDILFNSRKEIYRDVFDLISINQIYKYYNCL